MNKSIFPNRYFFLFLCFLAFSVCLSAQTSEGSQTAMEIETLLNTGAVTYAQAARFTLEAANVLATQNGEEAFNYAAERNWLPRNASPNDPARLDGIALLLMRSFEINGGIMYSLFGSARYAYRELMYLNVIQRRADPAMQVSGERLLFYVNRIYAQRESE